MTPAASPAPAGVTNPRPLQLVVLRVLLDTQQTKLHRHPVSLALLDPTQTQKESPHAHLAEKACTIHKTCPPMRAHVSCVALAHTLMCLAAKNVQTALRAQNYPSLKLTAPNTTMSWRIVKIAQPCDSTHFLETWSATYAYRQNHWVQKAVMGAFQESSN